MRAYFSYLILVFAFVNCSSEGEVKFFKNKSQLIEEKYYVSNKVKSRIEYNFDTVKHGKSIVYYEDGTIKEEEYYNEGVQDSIDREFYPNGNIKNSKYWLKGKPWAEYYQFYDSKEKVFYATNKDTLVRNEPKIKYYAYYDNNGSLAYERSVDSIGNKITSVSGSSIAFHQINSNLLNIDKSFDARFYIVNPRHTKRNFIINKYYGNKLIESDPFEIDAYYGCVFYETKFNKEGEYLIEGVSQIAELIGGEVNVDTVKIKIKVVAD